MDSQTIATSRSHTSLVSLSHSRHSSANLSTLIEQEAGIGANPKSFLRQMSQRSGSHRGSNRMIDNSNSSDDPENNFDVDEQRLRQSIRDAGQYSYGIDAVEVWVLDEETGWLTRPDDEQGSSSWWTNPKLSRDDNPALRRLDDPTEPDYVAPTPCMPGVDLAGILYQESTITQTNKTTFGGDDSDDDFDMSQRSISFSSFSKSIDSRRKKLFSGDMTKSFGRKKLFSKSPDLTFMNKSFGRKKLFSKNSDVSSIMSKSVDSRRKTVFGGKKKPKLPPTTTNSSNEEEPPATPEPEPPRRRMGRRHSLTSAMPAPALSDKLGVSGRESCGRDSVPEQIETVAESAIKFRDIYSLILDPDMPKSNRLPVIGQAGFTQAAGVPFQSGWHTGLVVFYTRCPTNKQDPYLTSIPNQVYMIHATEVIGSIVASTDARRAALAWKLRAEEEAGDNDSDAGPAANAAILDLSIRQGDFAKSYRPSMSASMVRRVNQWWRKCHGGALQPPPAKPFGEAGWSFIGVFTALMIILSFNQAMKLVSDDEYSVLLGPIGALMTLQYGLTPAPASQPRNVVYGQIISGAVTLPFTYIPGMPVIVRQSLAVAFAIATMSKMGVIHPPAGGAAIILASGTKSWYHYLLIVAASIISLIPCIAVNNLSQKRQYPTYWGFLKGIDKLKLFQKTKTSGPDEANL